MQGPWPVFFASSSVCISDVADDKSQQKISNVLLSGKVLPEVILSCCLPLPC